MGEERGAAGEKSLVEARLRFVARQRARRPESFDVDLDGRGAAEALGSGPPNRHGLPRVPVGQRVVTNWPVLDLGDVPRVPTEAWELAVDGLVEAPVVLDWEAFRALPEVEDESDFHCVTGWSRLANRWAGVRFADLAELVVPREEARFVRFTGYDRDPASGEAYTTSLPLERALDPDVLLVHAWEGAPLPPEHGGPVRVITPRLYAWKGTKWVRQITFLAEDRLGFWELRGYSNTARPWLDDRYATRDPA
jgi:DMSO/TMAO reductase YedYZ molybdopterin-dependent catalytic subunit